MDLDPPSERPATQDPAAPGSIRAEPDDRAAPAPAPAPVPGPDEEPAPWKELADLLTEERAHIDALRDGEARRVNPEGIPIGLALSGGGIRSATFSLGVVQALAQRGLLRRIDYLSTVSGGGYIGAWLSACIHHAREAGEADPIGEVEKRIRPSQIRKEGEEPNELRFLRAYSNYLTPRLGALSGDTLAALAGFVRNLCLNLFVGVASAGLLLAMLHGLIAVVHTGLQSGALVIGALAGGLALMAMAMMSMMLTLQSYDIRTLLLEARGEGTAEESIRLAYDALRAARQLQGVPSQQMLALARLWFALALRIGQGEMIVLMFAWLQHLPSKLIGPALGGAIVLGSIWLGAHLPEVGWLDFTVAAVALLSVFAAGSFYALMLLEVPKLDMSTVDATSVRRFAASVLAVLAGGACVSAWKTRTDLPRYILACVLSAAGAYALARFGSDAGLFVRTGEKLTLRDSLDLILYGPLALIGIFWLLYLLWMGTVGNSYSEFTREWLSRVMGGLTGVAAVWFITGLMIVHAAPAWQWSVQQSTLLMGKHASALAIGAAAAIVVLAMAIKHFRTKQRSPHSAPAPEDFPLVNLAALTAMLAVLAALTIAFQTVFAEFAHGRALAVADDASYAQVLAAQLQRLEAGFAIHAPSLEAWTHFMPSLTLIVIFASIAAIAFWAVDVNTFSLQNLYRNRLVRCYLGAAHHRDRLENPYAGFDPNDDLELRQFAAQRPYVLVSAALNITQGADLAWQQRMAASFLFSPRRCGFWLESTEGSSVVSSDPLRGGYVRTDQFVNEPAGFRRTSRGVMVGTAIASSGAAVSSQMGFASRGPLAFLLTLLNVRLGRWLPNPARQDDKKRWGQNSPPFGAFWYLSELLGVTNERSRWVYVSDGGHFENTGLYELVRRRCALIISVDAGADPHGSFGDLGNAVRKCRIDFGVDIHVDTDRLRVNPRTGRSEHPCSIGVINYPEGPEGQPKFQGHLIYIKPLLPKSLKPSAAMADPRADRVSDMVPADIVSYRRRYPEFPHQPTLDQWFTESQFESYRQLGYLLGMHALKEGDPHFDAIASPRHQA